jgi:hypothetical protein
LTPRDLGSGMSSVLFQRFRCAITVRRFHLYPIRRCSAIGIRLLRTRDPATATFDRLGGQPTSHHLRLPAVDHRVEHAIFGSKKTDLGVSKNPRNEARNSLHGNLASVETCI